MPCIAPNPTGSALGSWAVLWDFVAGSTQRYAVWFSCFRLCATHTCVRMSTPVDVYTRHTCGSSVCCVDCDFKRRFSPHGKHPAWLSKEHKWFSHRQGGVRLFDAGIKFCTRGINFQMMLNEEHTKYGPVHSWPRVKILTPRHLCEHRFDTKGTLDRPDPGYASCALKSTTRPHLTKCSPIG